MARAIKLRTSARRVASCCQWAHSIELDSDPVVVIGLRRIEELQDEARYHRDRYDLYKAKAYGPRPTSELRLKELERRHRGADSRLRQALRENEQPPDVPE